MSFYLTSVWIASPLSINRVQTINVASNGRSHLEVPRTLTIPRTQTVEFAPTPRGRRGASAERGRMSGVDGPQMLRSPTQHDGSKCLAISSQLSSLSGAAQDQYNERYLSHEPLQPTRIIHLYAPNTAVSAASPCHTRSCPPCSDASSRNWSVN